MKRSLTLLFTLLMTGLLALVPAALAQEEEATPEMTPEMTAEAMGMDDTSTYLRFAHFAPNVDGVDVYVNEELTEQTELMYPSVTDWIAVEAASYDLDVTPTGGALADAAISVDDVTIGPGYVTVAVIEDAEGQPTPIVINEMRSDLLPGTTGLTFMNALSSDVSVNFARNDVPFATELGADTQRALYVPVDTDAYTFAASDTFNPDTSFGEEEIDLNDGSYYLIAAVGTADDPQFVVHETTGGELALLRGNIEAPGTIIEAVESREAIAGFTTFFDNAGLTETLSGEGPYTVFLPAEYLIDEIEAAVGDDTDLLANTLQNHVVEGNYGLGEILDLDSVTTLAGNTYDITIDGNNVLIGDYQVLRTNIFATNGVIHVIDGILTLPDGSEMDSDMEMEATEEMDSDMDMEATEEADMDMEATEESED